MPLFEITKTAVERVRVSPFKSERELQHLVERNLGPIFNSRLVATEFVTGARHSGRIDTLALSEDDSPVIIEYKLTESATLINQSLFYLSWLEDHHGDFEVAAQAALGDVNINWDEIRVLCVAPSFTKYDLHMVQTIDRQIELWTYQRFENGILQLEPAFGGAATDLVVTERHSEAVPGRARKSADTEKRIWTYDNHLEGKSDAIRELMGKVRDFMLTLDEAIEEVPRQNYVAYRTTQNIVCMEAHVQKVTLFVKLDPKTNPGPQGISRDMSNIGHFGTGDLEITLKGNDDFELAQPLMRKAYDEVGG